MSRISKYFTEKLFIVIICGLPLFILAQPANSKTDAIHHRIDQLSGMLTTLKAEQNLSYNIDVELESPHKDYTRQDKRRLADLRRKQVESRARIDALTLEIIKLSKQLEDPRKRYALAKKIQEPRKILSTNKVLDDSDTTLIIETVSARSIDLAAVKLVRKGKSLDQSRLLIVDQLSSDQVLTFYQGLSKPARYELYDIADEIVVSEAVELKDARRSAIYFYLFTK